MLNIYKYLDHPLTPLYRISEKISTHIQMGGSIDDDVGCYLVEHFVNTFLSVPKNYKPLSKKEKKIVDFIKLLQNDNPETKMCEGKFVTGIELQLILKESIRISMPNIWVKKKMPVIAGSLIFLDPLKNKYGLEMMYILMPEFGSNGRSQFLKDWAKSSTHAILDKYKKKRFDYDIKINYKGTGLDMNSALQEYREPTIFPFFIIIIILFSILFIAIKSK